MIPVLFNPFNYFVTEGVDSNAVITLEALAAHPFAFNVTVLSQSGSAIGGLCEWNRAPYASTVYCSSREKLTVLYKYSLDVMPTNMLHK